MVKITNSELQPNDPIFSNGLTFFAPVSRPLTPTSSRDTDGTSQEQQPTFETESLKRLRAMTRSAGPKDKIYSSGLTMTSVPALRPSTPTSPNDTDGTSQEQPAATHKEK